MSLLTLDFALDFPVVAGSNIIRQNLKVDLANPQANPRLLNDMLRELDLATDEGLRMALWEIEEWIQYDIVIPKTRFKNHKLTRDKLSFDVLLTVEGNGPLVGHDSFDITPDDYSEVKGSTADEFDEWIISSYENSDRNFTVTDVKGIYIP